MVLLTGVRWRVCPVRQMGAGRRLVILRGYARADGRLHKVAIRAMLDTGAQGEFMTPALAKRLGAEVETGKFGVAVEAFGRASPLTRRVRGVELSLPGAHPGSLLAQDFVARWDFIVSPSALSRDYDLLLGTHFLRRFRLGLTFHEPGGIRLTAADGRTTQMQEQQQQPQEEQIEQEAEPDEGWRVQTLADPRASAHAAPRPLTQAQRRAFRRELRDGEEARLELALRAARECPDLVMSTDELERLWRTSKPGSVTIYTLLASDGQDTSTAPAGSAASCGRAVQPPRLREGQRPGGERRRQRRFAAAAGGARPG